MKSRLWPVLTVVLVAVVALTMCQNQRLRANAGHWRNVAAHRDSLHQDAEGRVHTAAATVESFRDLRRVYGDSLSEIRRENRRLRAREREFISVVAGYEADTVYVPATDTVYVEGGASISRVDFELEFDHATVTGYTLTPPPVAHGTIQYEPISLGIVLSQLRDSSYRVDVQGPPELDIRVLDATVVDRPKSWLRRNHPWIASIGLLVIWEWIR